MQCIYQKANGERVSVNQDAYNQMIQRYGRKISHIIRRRGLVIFCLRGNETAKPEYCGKYGGGRLRNPFQSMKTNKTVREVGGTYW